MALETSSFAAPDRPGCALIGRFVCRLSGYRVERPLTEPELCHGNDFKKGQDEHTPGVTWRTREA